MTDVDSARARLEASMLDACTITTATTTSTDATTGDVTVDTDPVYEGPCMITRRGTLARESQRGGETEYVDQYQVSVPFDAGPFAIGHIVTVDGCVNDPDLAGQTLTVADVVYGTRAARRRLMCELTKVGPR